MAVRRRWRALDNFTSCNDEDSTVTQQAALVDVTRQRSEEWIIVRDSEDVTVNTTDTQVAIGIQANLQAAIAAVISISVGSSDQGRAVAQDVLQYIRTRQSNRQRTIIDGSRCVSVTTTDTDLSVNIQVLLQILLAIVVKLDVF